MDYLSIIIGASYYIANGFAVRFFINNIEPVDSFKGWARGFLVLLLWPILAPFLAFLMSILNDALGTINE